jgi:N-acyl-D-aspartate/D-glutamate deacylase
MHDLLVKGGTIVDGTGAPAFTGDVAVSGGKIVGVGKLGTSAHRVVDATGLLVAPGWVDLHTHYDGQATWDSLLTPSSGHGVTTAVMGNCGVGFAPVRPTQRDLMIELMEGVEDIPGIVLQEGVRWDWETFAQYLDALDVLPRAIDICAQLPHAPLRVYAMGERGWAREAANEEDLKIMTRLVRESLDAGAFGFSTSRTLSHRTRQGEHVPSLGAARKELLAIAAAMRETGRGVLQVISDFDDVDEEFDLLRALSRTSGRPLSFSLLQHDHAPDRWRELLRRTSAAWREGLEIRAQVAARAVGLVQGLECSMNPFFLCPGYVEIAEVPLKQRVELLRQPGLRARILAEWEIELPTPRLTTIARGLHKLFPLAQSADYEPSSEASLEAAALRAGRRPKDYAYDALLMDGGTSKFYMPLYNYTGSDLSVVHEMMSDPHALFGLGDAGAHCGYICDSSFPTYLLSHWAKGRTRGPRFDVEWLVEAQTRRNARAIGLNDRGTLLPGMKADMNLIDLDRMHLPLPTMAYDLPAGGRRLVQNAEGYVSTIVSGQEIFGAGQATGSLPGRLVRAS